MFDVTVIGAGAVGLSAAWQLMKAYPDLKILVLEKEKEVSAHQTGHNSGVIHSGLYYKPGSKRAENCTLGRELIADFAEEHQVSYDLCGKIVVATAEEELQRLDKIYNTGHQNGLTNIKKIDEKEITDIEPYCKGIAGIWVPYTGIIDFPGVCRALHQLIIKNKSNEVRFNQELTEIQDKKTHYVLKTKTDNIQTKYLISCAGLQSDRIAKMQGLQLKMRIVGFRGDYYDLHGEGIKKVKNLIYPVPNPAFPFLGVHFTRMILGGTECGPNAVFTFKREGYGKTDFNFKDTFEALSYKGTWKLFFEHWRFGINEYRRAFSKKLFLKQLQRLIPSLVMEDLVPGRAGVRAMALGPNGNIIDDFAYETTDRSIHVLNAPSPAATACLAIGLDIKDFAQKTFQL